MIQRIKNEINYWLKNWKPILTIWLIILSIFLGMMFLEFLINKIK